MSNSINTNVQKQMDLGFHIGVLIKTAPCWKEYKRCWGFAEEFFDSLGKSPEYKMLLMKKHLIECASLKLYSLQNQN